MDEKCIRYSEEQGIVFFPLSQFLRATKVGRVVNHKDMIFSAAARKTSIRPEEAERSLLTQRR